MKDGLWTKRWFWVLWLDGVGCDICLYFLKRRYKRLRKKGRKVSSSYFLKKHTDNLSCMIEYYCYDPWRIGPKRCLRSFVDFIVLGESILLHGLFNDYRIALYGAPSFLETENINWKEQDIECLRSMVLSSFDNTIKIFETLDGDDWLTRRDINYLLKRYQFRRQLVREATSSQEIKSVSCARL